MNQPNYVNGVWGTDTNLSPRKLKKRLRKTERQLGRRRSADKYASRAIDLDIIVYGMYTIKTHCVQIPDIHIGERAYLSVPLLELDPELILPDTEKPIRNIAIAADRNGLLERPDITGALRSMIQNGQKPSL